jgi:hypothetical protein
VYGVAIPTVRGVRNVLDAVGAAKREWRAGSGWPREAPGRGGSSMEGSQAVAGSSRRAAAPKSAAVNTRRPPSCSRSAALPGARRVLWHNLREEPVLYVNGKPYVVREADQPFCNLEYTGIDRSRWVRFWRAQGRTQRPAA